MHHYAFATKESNQSFLDLKLFNLIFSVAPKGRFLDWPELQHLQQNVLDPTSPNASPWAGSGVLGNAVPAVSCALMHCHLPCHCPERCSGQVCLPGNLNEEPVGLRYNSQVTEWKCQDKCQCIRTLSASWNRDGFPHVQWCTVWRPLP